MIASLGTTLTQDFDNLDSAGVAQTAMPAEWGFVESGVAADQVYTASNGSVSTAGTYSYGPSGNDDRALGAIGSADVSTVFGTSFVNQTGSVIGRLRIAYQGEQWRNSGNGDAGQLDFQYSFDASSLTTGTWHDLNGLDFAAPNTSAAAGSVDGNAWQNQTSVAATMTGHSIANGATVWIRWTSGAGTDGEGLAIDDLSVTAYGMAIDPVLSLGSAAGVPGGNVTVPLTLSVPVGEPAVAGVTSFNLLISIDNTKLSFATATGFSTTGTATAGFSVTPNQQTAGTTSTLIFNVDGGAFGITPTIAPGSSIVLGQLTFGVLVGATGVARLNILNSFSGVTTAVFDDSFSELALIPAPTNGIDAVNDGTITLPGGSNQPPVNTAPTGALPGTEDTPRSITTVSVSDPDAADTLTTTVSVPDNTFGTFTANAGAGTAVVTIQNSGARVQIVGTQTNVNAALQTLIFTPALNRATPPDTAPTITVLTSDGTASDTDSFTINLAEINDTPVVGADSLAAANEDSAPIAIPVATLLANDSRGAPNESTQTLTMSSTFTSVVGGTVQLVGSDVVFTPTPNYSGPASFTYSVTDNGTNGGMPSPLSGSGVASFTINSVNDVPTFTPGPNQVVPFATNTQQTVNNWASAITGGGGESQTLSFNVTNNSNAALFSVLPAISPTGTLTYTPTGTAGTATITLVLQDNGGTANGGVDTSAPVVFTITVNSPGNAPTINAISDLTIAEGAPLQTINLTGITDGGDPVQQGISITANSSNASLVPIAVNYVSPSNTGSLTFTSPINGNGASTITVTVRDSGLDLIAGNADDLTTIRVFTVTVTPVNDAPTFVIGANQSANEDAPAQTVPGFATGISTGPNNESTQTVAFNITGNSNASLFAAGPAIAPDGTLTYTPAANANGTATITVTLSDNGGTANGGVDTSAPQSFTITINPVNDRPTFTAVNPAAVNEDAPAQSVPGFVSAFNPGPNEAGQAVTAYTVANVSNPALFAVAPSVATNGTLTYTLAANANGTATFDLTVTDDGGTALGGVNTSLPQTFTITANAVNDRPTFTAANSAPVNEDAAAQTVAGFVSSFSPGGGTDENGQTPAYTVANVSNPTLFLTAPAVAANGTLTYQLSPNAFGVSTFDLTVTDSGGVANGGIATSLPQTFTITVNSVNDAPAIAVGANQTVPFNAVAQTVNGFATVTSVGPANEAGQTVAFNITSNSNPSLFSSLPTINAAGQLTYTPAAGQQGTATITVVGQDSGGTANDGVDLSAPVQFTITVSPPLINNAPTIATINPLTINEDAGLQTVNFSGVSDGGDIPAQGVTVTVSSSNPTLIPTPGVAYVSPNATGSLSFTPVANASGTSTITVTVRDSGFDLIPGNADDGITTSAFLVTVNPVNDAPSFVNSGNQTVNEDAGAQTIAGFATSISAGPADEAGQTLTFNVTSNSNPTLFDVAPSIAANGTLTYTPAFNANGSATITVTLSDNGGVANGGVNMSGPQTFTITVNSVNDTPAFVAGPNQTVFNDAPLQSISGWATAISAGPANEAGQIVTFQVTGNTNPAIFATPPAVASNGTLTYAPAAGMSGTATISVVVQDNGGTTNGGVNQSAPQTFTITVNPAPINNLPTINAIGNLSINQNAGPQIVNLSGITAGGESQVLAVTATSNNPALIPTPIIGYASPNATGTLTFTSAVGQAGSATITVTVRDAGFDGILNSSDDGVTTTNFTVQVNDINDPPVANDSTIAAQLNTPVNSALSATDPDGSALTFTLASMPVLGTISNFNPTTGAFTYTPNPGATGLDTFNFSVSDGTFSDAGTVRIAIQGAMPVVTPSNGDLLVIGTPDPDQIIITHVAAGVVQVRTQAGSAYYPLSNRLIVNSGESDDYVIITGVIVPTTVDLAGGNDYVSSGPQDDTIIGGAGNDQINGSGGVNVIWGDNVGEQDLATGGNDVLSSLGSNDVLYGGGGADQIFPGAGDDYVNAGQGDDTVSAGAGNDRVFGGQGTDFLFGDEGNDVITGGGGADMLSGRTGSDVLIGGLGGDSINGDDGSDLLFGGDTTNSASSTAGDANDLALIAMLSTWATSHPAGLATSVAATNDGAPDFLNGYIGDDDMYFQTGDSSGDFGLPFMGTDRWFSV